MKNIAIQQIKESESLVNKITKHIAQYKSQEWRFTVQRKSKNATKDKWKTISSGTDISSVVDMNVQEGEGYVYRVEAANKNGSSKWSAEYGKQTLNSTLTSPSNLRINSDRSLLV